MARTSRGYWLKRRSEPNGVWYIYWTERGADGRSRRVGQSTGCTGETEARQCFQEFLADVDKPPQPDAPTVASILDGYLHDRKGRVADLERIELCARHLKEHLGWIAIESLRPSHSKTYALQRSHSSIMPGTIGRELRALRAALHWAHGERLVGQIPRMEIPSTPPPRDRWLTREEAARLIDAAVTPHVKLFIQLALGTAARSGAILELRWTDVDFERAIVAFGRGAGKKRRATVPLGHSLAESLHQAHMAAESPWVVEYRGGRVGSIKKAFARSVARAGIAHCTPHDLRHTAITWLVQGGCSIEEAAAFAGHTNTGVTWSVYAAKSPDWLRQAAKVLEG